MRILLVCDERDGGPAARQALRLARGLAARDHRVLVAGPEGTWLSARCFASVVEHVDLPMRGPADLRSFCRLAAVVQRCGIELLHGHGGRSSLYAGVVARLARRPAVATIHSVHGASLCGLLHRVLATHEALRRRLIDDRLLVGRIEVVHEGVPEPPSDLAARGAALRAGLGILPTDVAVAIPGPLDPRAGHRLVIRAVERLHRRRGDVHLCVIGGGSTDHSPELKERLEGGELARRAHFPGRAGAWARLAGVDVLALPDPAAVTRLAAIEALAAGVPVIAAVTEGVREVVRHGQTGLLFARGDGAMLDAMLTMLVEDAGWRDRLGANSRIYHRDGFTLERMVTETERIYREVGRNAAPRSDRKAS